MADGNLVRQSNVGKDSVVFGPSVYDVPLLPYEKQLIETIGITEDEYRRFTAEVRRRGAVRPAEYAQIPDVQATGGEAVLISLAISLVLTGVSYLLTPKPKAPEASKRTQLDLGDVTGASRFTPSRGFDSINELADYASPIPIIFGLYQKLKVKGKDQRVNIGGMLVTPKLVWSRILSHGTQQSAKLMFVVGEQGVNRGEEFDGIAAPDITGIFLGNNALDSVFKNFFAFYWKKNTSTSKSFRIRRGDAVHGTVGGVDKGDPGNYTANDDDVFIVPASQSKNAKAFCHAYSPANNTQFGVYGAIANGTGYRVNYEVVSIPRFDEDNRNRTQDYALALRRLKIVGDRDNNFEIGDEGKLESIIKQDQLGRGRMYSPRMGLISLIDKSNNNNKITVDGDYSGKQAEEVKVGINDVVTFVLDPSSIEKDAYQRSSNRGGENVDDINQTVKAEQIAADEALQVGEQFAIGNTKWIVTARGTEQFDPDGKDRVLIKMKCIDTDESGQKTIGLVSDKLVIDPKDGHTGDGFKKNRTGVGAGFFPLTRIATGIVRNNRPAIVTEIGLRSRVFQRLNGICAFNSTPTASELRKFDDQEVTVRSGTYTGTIARTSVFQVFVRPAGLDKSGNPFSFERMSPYFAVTGSKPVDQYNFIRFRHPEEKEFEFKFVPIPASELRTLAKDGTIIVLNANQSENNKQEIISEKVTGLSAGTFTIETSGYRTTKETVVSNKEFIRDPRLDRFSAQTSIPKTVVGDKILPAELEGNFKFARSMEFHDYTSNVTAIGRQGAFFHEIFGRADDAPGGEGTTQTKTTREIISGDTRWIKIRWKVQKLKFKSSHYASRYNNERFFWRGIEATIVGSSPGFRVGAIITVRRGTNATSGPTTDYDDTNPFKNNHPQGTMRFSGIQYKITDITQKDTKDGRSQAYNFELFGSALGKDIGERSSVVSRTLTKGSKSIRLRFTASVIPLPRDHFSGRNKGWGNPYTISVVKNDLTDDTWNKNEKVQDLVNIDINNPFYTAYDRVGSSYEITDVEITPASKPLTGETVFEGQSQIADISFYRGLVQKSNESEPEHNIVYVNEIIENPDNPKYENMTIAGLSLKAGRNFTSLDQMRCWLGSGLHVKRLHPNKANTQNNPYDESGSPTFRKNYGPSNLFTDLVFFLMTDQTAGAGALLGMNEKNADDSLLNVSDFEITSRFLRKQQLFFNGVIVERTNLRQFITDTAPYFLCNFILADGKFSLRPAIPFGEKSGRINTGTVQIDQLFTSGNILEDSFKVEYLRSEERRPFKAVMRYRQETRNKLPEEKVIEVKLPGKPDRFGLDELPEEQFDLTQFCTSESHARKVGLYFLGLRQYVTHTISFSTTVEGLNLKAGSYIRVVTSSSPYSSANNGTVSSSGVVTSVEELKDGTYKVAFFKTDSDDVQRGEMSVSGGTVQNTKFHDSVFTIINNKVSENIYVVEQLTFSQEGTVDIVASEHQCDVDDNKPISKLAKLIATVDDELVDD